MVTNLWLEKIFTPVLQDIFKKRRLDSIPAICDNREGICILSVTSSEIARICNALSRGVKINTTGTMSAKIIGTAIVVNVCSIHSLEDGA